MGKRTIPTTKWPTKLHTATRESATEEHIEKLLWTNFILESHPSAATPRSEGWHPRGAGFRITAVRVEGCA
jgi:hypothetical protein